MLICEQRKACHFKALHHPAPPSYMSACDEAKTTYQWWAIQLAINPRVAIDPLKYPELP